MAYFIIFYKGVIRASSESLFSIQYEFVITMQMFTKTGKWANIEAI